jgi:hypothetical protein
MTSNKRLHAEESGHLVVEEAAAGTVGLDPFSVDDELGDGALADVGDNLLGGAGGLFNVNFFVGDGVLIEEAFRGAAITAPGGRVNEEFHIRPFYARAGLGEALCG